jgi:hypothetical protein
MFKIKVLSAAAVLVAGLGAASSAQAYDGCGWGYHANRWGACRPNYRPVGYYGPSAAYVYSPSYVYGYEPRPGVRFHVPGLTVSFR